MTTNQTIDGVPRELRSLIERVTSQELGMSAKKDRAEAAHELRALLDAPAVPAQLSVPEECPHLIVFDDTEREQLMFSGAGAREAALKTWEKISASWNAHLFVRVGRNSRDDRYPSAGHKPTPQPQGEPVAYRYKEFQQAYENEKPWELATVALGLVYLERKSLAEKGELVGKEREHYMGLTIEPLYGQPAPVAVVMPDRDSLRDIIAQAIGGDTYDCVRVWSAWGVGTMSEDDFVPVVEQEARLYEIADACLDEVTRLNSTRPTHANPPPGTEPSGSHPHNDGLDDYRKTK